MSVFVYSVIYLVCVKFFILQSELGTLALKIGAKYNKLVINFSNSVVALLFKTFVPY
jgi:hypothetical protein